MTFYKLKAAPILLIEDDNNKNILPLVLELTQYEKSVLNLFCYEQPVSSWREIFKDKTNVVFNEEFNTDIFDKYTNIKSSILVDSVNQMALSMGWCECLKCLKKLILNTNIAQIILILHKDCLSHNSKWQTHLSHIASAIVSFDVKKSSKICIQLKKSGKVVKTEEILSYDNKTSTLISTSIVKEEIKTDEQEKPLPNNLSTFKIEMEQTDKLEKYKLKLPYMSKINEGESKVYYEPDAVDDWDDEDPDEDLDI